jgi:hypothetical protein
LVITALVLLLFSCTHKEDPPPEPRTLQSGWRAIATGDLERLRADLGKDAGFAERATHLAQDLDPEGWLVAVGASGREHRLGQAAEAMRAGDDGALREALGFGDQALKSDILQGGHSIESRRAGGRKYYRKAPQAIDLMDGMSLPALPGNAQAMHAVLFGTLDGRQYRLGYGLNLQGLTDLRASRELAYTSADRPDNASAFSSADAALPRTAEWYKLNVDALDDERWYAARLTLLLKDGTLLRCEIERDGGWYLLKNSRSTLTARLEQLRDERLQHFAAHANMIARSLGRWPRGTHELSLKGFEYIDPTAPDARRGWAKYDADPPRHLQLADDPGETGVAAWSNQRTPTGHRAVRRDGTLTWKRASG